jgi:hypothetical protein
MRTVSEADSMSSYRIQRLSMFRRLRETGPAFLIPAAWGVVIATHLDIITTRPVFVMHGVMCVLLVVFAVTSWHEMETGVLRIWRRVILAGTPFAFVGLAGFLAPTGSTGLFAVALAGWIFVPAVGFVFTARAVTAGARIYLTGATLCLLGAGLYAFGAGSGYASIPTIGLASVAVGQTAGILDAVVRY